MIDVILCASGADEVHLVSLISNELASSLRVTRRCADLTEALGCVTGGVGDVAVIDVDTRDLDRTVVHSMANHGVPVVALESAHSRRGAADVGVTYSIRAGSGANEVYEVIAGAVVLATESPRSEWEQPEAESALNPLVAVWGPRGGPGRTFIASNMAWCMAQAGTDVALVDADTEGPSLSQVLGVVDDVPGLVAACRASMKGTLTPETIETLAPRINDSLRLLSGIGVPARWVEVQRQAYAHVLRELRSLASVTIADIAASIEPPRGYDADEDRNAVGFETLAAADHVLVVVAADPVSITRVMRDVELLADATSAPVSMVVNRSNLAVSTASIERSLRARMEIAEVYEVPIDVHAAARSAWDGTLVCESVPRSGVARAIETLTRSIFDVVGPGVQASGQD